VGLVAVFSSCVLDSSCAGAIQKGSPGSTLVTQRIKRRVPRGLSLSYSPFRGRPCS
jgi:hypothetical protein